MIDCSVVPVVTRHLDLDLGQSTHFTARPVHFVGLGVGAAVAILAYQAGLVDRDV